jgi:F-type H+-transporting ATPase subunit epsilon
MPQLRLKIVTPERVMMDEDVKEVSLPTPDGQITVLPHLIPLFTLISPGEIIVHGEKDKKIDLVYGGFIYVEADSKVTVLADSAEHLSELNEKEIQEAKRRAEDLKKKAVTIEEQISAEAALARSIAQLKSLRKHRHTSSKNINMDQSDRGGL